MPGTLIRDVTLFDGTGAEAVHHAAVLVRDGHIAWVGKDDAAPPPPDGVGVIRGAGLTLLPGLIDSHVHLCSEPLRPAEYDPMAVTTEELALRVLAHAQDALRAGVTTVADCGGRDFVTLDVRDAIAACAVVGPTILTAGQGISITGGHFHWFSIEADSRDELRKAVRVLAKRGVDFIKLFGTGGGSTMESNPALAQYSVEDFRTVIEEAERSGILVTTHVHGTPGIRNAVDAGIHRLEHVQFFDSEGNICFDEELTRRIADLGIPISLGMARRWRTDSSIEAHLTPRQRQQRDIREQRIAVVRRFRELGVRLVASTDAGMTMTPFGDLPNLLAFLREATGMSATEAIHSATGLAAEALGIAADKGTVLEGKQADLVLASGDLSKDLTSLLKPVMVFKAGLQVVKDGRLCDAALPGLDFDRLMVGSG